VSFSVIGGVSTTVFILFGIRLQIDIQVLTEVAERLIDQFRLSFIKVLIRPKLP
jgi:hypothetical protein